MLKPAFDPCGSNRAAHPLVSRRWGRHRLDRAAGTWVWPAGLLAWTLLATGCSTEQIYNAAAGWRRNECYKIGDLEQRERCLKEAERPYDAYRKGAP